MSGGVQVRRLQVRRVACQEGCRSGGLHVRRGACQAGCRSGGVQVRRGADQEGCRSGGWMCGIKGARRWVSKEEDCNKGGNRKENNR